VGISWRGGYAVEGSPLGIYTGPTLSVSGTSATVSPGGPLNVRVTGAAGAAVTITLPSVAAGLQDGQCVYVTTFDASGFPTQVVPANPGGGDNIVGGSQWNLANYGASAVFYARVASGVANWLVLASNTFAPYIFPLQPTLAAGAQGPLSLGSIIVPQGPRYAHSLWLACYSASGPTVLSGGTLTLSFTGLASSPATLAISSPNGASAQTFAPGNANRITVPNGTPSATGTLLEATVSTNAAFAGPTNCVAGLTFW
jgi:hypothetical protein